MRALASEIRDRLGPPPELERWPRVSIVVPNRDGAPQLRRLLAGLAERTSYPDFELIAVDNGSGDDSVELLRSFEAPFPISIHANSDNESFSAASNRGAKTASGVELLFLNNDVEPFEEGWLQELVACRRESGAGAVASTLICPDREHARSFRHGYGVQHRGLEFEDDGGRAVPRLRGWEDDPLDAELGEDVACDAVAAASLLIAKTDFERVGGFHPGYFYGYEDVDLCLALRAAGRPVLCSGRSIAIHYPVSTRRKMPPEQAREVKQANRELLWERWGPSLRPTHSPG